MKGGERGKREKEDGKFGFALYQLSFDLNKVSGQKKKKNFLIISTNLLLRKINSEDGRQKKRFYKV